MEVQKLKAKDLRIGNYVIFNTNDKPFQITPAGLLELSQIEGKPNPYFYEPILLNVDWLMRFGGKPLENGYWISVSNLKAELHFEVFNYTDEIVTTLKSQFSTLILDRIKYVHELQNLYFSLTKSELGGS